jgi:hypothetical protein
MAIQQEEHPDQPINVTQYAKQHQVPYQRLNARWNGRIPRSERTNSNLRVSEEDEQALVAYCKARNLIGILVPVKLLRDVVEQMLRRRALPGTKPELLGDRWAPRFMERHNLKKMK